MKLEENVYYYFYKILKLLFLLFVMMRLRDTLRLHTGYWLVLQKLHKCPGLHRRQHIQSYTGIVTGFENIIVRFLAGYNDTFDV